MGDSTMKTKKKTALSLSNKRGDENAVFEIIHLIVAF